MGEPEAVSGPVGDRRVVVGRGWGLCGGNMATGRGSGAVMGGGRGISSGTVAAGWDRGSGVVIGVGSGISSRTVAAGRGRCRSRGGGATMGRIQGISSLTIAAGQRRCGRSSPRKVGVETGRETGHKIEARQPPNPHDSISHQQRRPNVTNAIHSTRS